MRRAVRSSDVLMACVAEDRPEWYRMVENLAITVRNFGGRLADAPICAYFVDGFDESSARLLRELGVELQAVARYDPAHPTTNKLRMFQAFAERAAHAEDAEATEATEATEAPRPDGQCHTLRLPRRPLRMTATEATLLVALDCDTVVVGDFLDELVPGVVRAMPAMRSHLSTAQWHQLLDSVGLQPAPTPMITTKSRQAMPAPYLNSGVLFVPAEHARGLTTAWTRYVDEFVSQSAAGVREPWTGPFLDQVALSCALLDQQIPVRPIGPQLNLTTSIRLSGRLPKDADAAIGVLHYHEHVGPDGLLLGTDSAAVNRLVDRVNAVISSRRHGEPARPGPREQAARVLRRLTSVLRS